MRMGVKTVFLTFNLGLPEVVGSGTNSNKQLSKDILYPVLTLYRVTIKEIDTFNIKTVSLVDTQFA
jgi:hypothetical protein